MVAGGSERDGRFAFGFRQASKGRGKDLCTDAKGKRQSVQRQVPS
jgi:hypothetical protein